MFLGGTVPELSISNNKRDKLWLRSAFVALMDDSPVAEVNGSWTEDPMFAFGLGFIAPNLSNTFFI